jgi:epoxyqueuosine reductase
VELEDLLTMNDEALLERFGSWYMPKRDPRYLRRNALVVLGNVASGSGSASGNPRQVETTTLRCLLRRYLADEDPLLVQHAAWAARRGHADDLLHEEPWRTHPEVLAERARPHPRHDLQDHGVRDHEPLLVAVAQHRETGPDVPS